ncbi:MAG: tetratricopeptide repeat protein [Bacteroidota bacterium]
MTRILLIVLALGWLADDGAKQGREGNALYEKSDYAAAAAAYQAGLAALPADGDFAVRQSLYNNLGAALYRQGNYEEARDALDQAVGLAQSLPELARSAYNAGNTAFQQEDLEGALGYYEESMLADPANVDAKFNYEFVKRQLEEQQQNGDGGQDEQNQDPQQQEDGENNDEQDQQQQDDQQQEQDGEQEQQDQQQQQDDQQQEQDGEQQPQPDDGQQGEQNQQQQPSPADPTKLSKEQAERILQALGNEEQELLREVQKMNVPPRRVEKDW